MFLLLIPLIISCTQNINSKNISSSITPSDKNSENKTNSTITAENPEKELEKVKIIKHNELNIKKNFVSTENKKEMEELKKEFNCNINIASPQDYFGGYEPDKNLYICISENKSKITQSDYNYLFKDLDGKFKKEESLQKIYSPINTKEEALSFALSSGDRTINNVNDIKDFINKTFLSESASYYGGYAHFKLKIDKFQIDKNFKVFVGEVNETFVQKDENDNYKVNLFYFQLNIKGASCKPALREIIYQISKDGNIKELSNKIIIENGLVEDCVEYANQI